ncbi:MAG TPA: hypothetical protein PK527_10230 [Smithellaceae bacterium]|jgi:hypothetical protein|nr:hypothetical protein [Smithellaceae bacterium]HQB93516.1 hypothetical protein [Smithellaceae bacterium]HQM42999.1 hypothetical protein [Smithellaceae bacterium]
MSIPIQSSSYSNSSFLMNPSNIGNGINQDSSWNLVVKKGIRRLWSRTSITFGEPLYNLINSLFEVYKECSEPDWDGYGASPISEEAYGEAFKIIDSLPSGINMPEITCEPTGEIAFEWNRGKGRVFVVSVGGKHKINYAGIFGDNKTHGSEYFEEFLPPIVVENLRRLYSY